MERIDKEKNEGVKPEGYEKYVRRKENAKKTVRKTKDMKAWIDECDRDLSVRFKVIAEDISQQKDLKLVRLIGPTCAGKTTAARMLCKNFAAYGKRLHVISLDDFYFNTDVLREISNKNGNTKIDYDSPDTLDIAELERFVGEIFTKDRSHCPIFDFKVGKRNGYREYLCEDEDVFLFEGIQALYPVVSEIFAKQGHPSTEIYIATQSSIRIGGWVFEPNEIRLMRRIVRDRNFRNSEAEFTFELWHNVRENEEKNIFPYVSLCKYSIDTTQPYEIGVLKPYLISALSALPKGSEYERDGKRILEKLSAVGVISHELIGEDSLYKEFV